MSIELVLLDLDGVIRDISDLLYQCHKRSFERFYSPSDFDRTFTKKNIWRMKGIGKYNKRPESIKAVKAILDSKKDIDLDKILLRLDAEKVLDSLVKKQIHPQDEKQMKRINNIYHSVFVSKEAHSMTAIYPGVSAGIEMLRKSGKKVGIVTNSYRHTLKRDVPKGLIDRLDIMITHETIKNPKPSGYGIKRAAEAVGESIRDTVYIGDTVVDVRAAKDAGCESASLLCGMGIRAHLENEGTDVVFKDLYSAAKVLIHG